MNASLLCPPSLPRLHQQGHCKEDFADLLQALNKMSDRKRRGLVAKSERRRLSDRVKEGTRRKYDPALFSLSSQTIPRNVSQPIVRSSVSRPVAAHARLAAAAAKR